MYLNNSLVGPCMQEAGCLALPLLAKERWKHGCMMYHAWYHDLPSCSRKFPSDAVCALCTPTNFHLQPFLERDECTVINCKRNFKAVFSNTGGRPNVFVTVLWSLAAELPIAVTSPTFLTKAKPLIFSFSDFPSKGNSFVWALGITC